VSAGRGSLANRTGRSSGDCFKVSPYLDCESRFATDNSGADGFEAGEVILVLGRCHVHSEVWSRQLGSSWHRSGALRYLGRALDAPPGWRWGLVWSASPVARYGRLCVQEIANTFRTSKTRARRTDGGHWDSAGGAFGFTVEVVYLRLIK
jgi:hypothetical protein